MFLLIVCLLICLAIILVGSPSWKSPPVGIGVLLAVASAAAVIYQMFGHR